jgi:hypothetical protein
VFSFSSEALLFDPARALTDHLRPVRERIPGNDLTQLFLPLHGRAAAEAARFGWPATWDVTGFGGRPRVGNPQASIWYPPMWLVWKTGWLPLLSWLTVLHLAWSGAGGYLLARRLGISRTGAVVASGLLSTSPFLVAQAVAGHLPHIWTSSWYPWVFLLVFEVRGGKRGAFFALPIVLALALLAGHIQEWLYLVIALGIWMGWDAFCQLRRGEWLTVARAVWVGGGVFALTIGLAAIELVPDILVRPWVQPIAPADAREFDPYRVRFLHLTQLLSPLALGGPSDHAGPANYWESAIGLGLWNVFLVASGIARGRPRGVTRGWALLLFFSLIFATGRDLQLAPLAARICPVLGEFRVPSRALFLTNLAAGILAGFGLDTWRTSGSPIDVRAITRRWLLCLICVLALVFLSSVLVHVVRLTSPGLVALNHCAVDVGFWLSILTLALVYSRIRRGGALSRTAIHAVACVSILLVCGYAIAIVRTGKLSEAVEPRDVTQALARLVKAEPWRIRAQDSFFGDAAAILGGFEKTNVQDSFQPVHAALLFEASRGIFGTVGPFRATTREALSNSRVALDLMSARFLVADRAVHAEAGITDLHIVASGPIHRPFYEPSWTIRENPTALPRAYVVPQARVPDPAWSVDRILAASSPRDFVWLAENLPGKFAGSRQLFRPAKYEASHPDRVSIEVETSGPGYLVVSDTWMPGWRAWLDESPVPIARGQIAQRVVALPDTGRHRVLMTYSPPGLTEGLALTGCTAGVLVLLGIVTHRGKLGGRSPALVPSSVSGWPTGESSNMVKPVSSFS